MLVIAPFPAVLHPPDPDAEFPAATHQSRSPEPVDSQIPAPCFRSPILTTHGGVYTARESLTPVSFDADITIKQYSFPDAI